MGILIAVLPCRVEKCPHFANVYAVSFIDGGYWCYKHIPEGWKIEQVVYDPESD